MSIREIELKSFRNHDQIMFEFGTGLNVIWGENGSGKTAVLEAIYSLSMGRSFRTSKHKDLLKSGKTNSSITGIFSRKEHRETLQLNQTSEGKRRFLINGSPIESIKELIGRNPAVVLSPEEQTITKGNPGDQRMFFDKMFAVISPEYVNALGLYFRSLKQRNQALLDFKKTGRGNRDAVKAWDEMLVDNGLVIWSARKDLFRKFSIELDRTKKAFPEEILLKCEHKPEAVDKKAKYMEELDKRLSYDISRGRTSRGPHRDKYQFLYGGKDLRQYGSQGEHKLALALIKIAEFRFVRQLTGNTPIFLLDDLFARLDRQRSEQILELLEEQVFKTENAQAIITTTDLFKVEKQGLDLSSSENKSFHLERA